MKIFKAVKFLLSTLLLSTGIMLGQNVAGAGTQPTDTVQGGISLNNLNIHLDVPAGVVLHYNSNIWQNGGNGTKWSLQETYTNNNYPWNLYNLFSSFQSPLGLLGPTELICGSTQRAFEYTNWIDPQGNAHVFTPVTLSVTGGTYGTCSGTVTSSSFLLTDGSGVTVNLNANSANTITYKDGSVTTFAGTGIEAGTGIQGIGVSSTDTNGNSTTVASSSDFATATITSPLGSSIVTTGNCPSTTYTTLSGSQSITVTCAQFVKETKFQCAGITDFNGNVDPNGNVTLPTSIALPDGTFYKFTYESQVAGTTTARIASVTYPNGSTTTYTYTGANNGINCSDGSAIGLQVTSLDGTWTYTRNVGAGTTTVTSPSPASNVSVYTFSTQASSPFASFLTQEVSKQGSGAILSTKVVCYNGNTTSCATATAPTFPLTEMDTYTTPNSGAYSARTKTVFDCASVSPCYNNVVEVDSYDFGAATPFNKTVLVSLGSSWNGSSCVSIGSGINNLPCKAFLEDGSSSVLRTTLFTYDSNGNLKTEKTGSLSTSATYNTNGTLATVTDVSGNTTSIAYGQCNSLLATKTTPPISSLSVSTTWDNKCLGLPLSTTDPNKATTNAQYNDPFLRETQSTDALGNATNYSYTPSTFESKFSVGVDIDGFTTLDQLGRTLYSQSKNTIGSWDTTQFGYTWNSTGRVSTVSVPCAASKGTGNCASGVATSTHDALGRSLIVTDGGGGTTTNTYATSTSCTASEPQCQIVTSTLGPAPADEVVKEVAAEVNGLGQLLATCIISTSSDSTACGFGGYNGVPTVYVYNTDGTLSSEARSSNAATQTHSFTYDSLGRVLTVHYPESGTTTFTYDTTSTSGCASSPGNLVKAKDAVGNVSCYLYDSLGRLTGINYSGTNFDGTNKAFVWDDATVNGVKMGNTKGRIAESYTYYATSGSKVVDEGFSYSLRGELTDVYESTPNSGGYYHTIAAYFPTGTLSNLNLSEKYSWVYTADGIGRPYGLSQGSTSVVKSTTYNASSQPLVVTYGSSDTDAYTYDINTGRISSYASTLAGKTSTGQLTWNANGTLRELAITDNINPAGTQSCYYGFPTVPGYDDQGRLAYIDCTGNLWGQGFTYDAFGNLTKQGLYPGSTSWNPGYNENNNRYTLSGTSYDANGNVLKDTINTYSWNQDNKPLTVKGSTSAPVAYDAMGNRAEQFLGSTYKESLISPVGILGLMSKTSVSSLRVPLPGGGIYDPSANNIWHPDWQGSYRLISGLGTSKSVSDRAFAPYGEVYNNIGSSASPNFTGDNQDLIAGVYDTPNRELDQTQGRWVSVDPVHSSWNGYAYTANPLGEIDPSGLDSEGVDTCNYCVLDPSWDSGEIPSFFSPNGTGAESNLSYSTGQAGAYDTPANAGADAAVASYNALSDIALPGEPPLPTYTMSNQGSAQESIVNVLESITAAAGMGKGDYYDDVELLHLVVVTAINNPAPGGSAGMSAVSAADRALIRAANRADLGVDATLANDPYLFDPRGKTLNFMLADQPSFYEVNSQRPMGWTSILGRGKSWERAGFSVYQESLSNLGFWRTSDHWGVLGSAVYNLNGVETLEGGVEVEPGFWVFDHPVSGFTFYP